MNKTKFVLTSILTFIAIIIIDFLVIAGLVRIICWAFEYPFTIKLAIGIWAIGMLLGNRDAYINNNKHNGQY